MTAASRQNEPPRPEGMGHLYPLLSSRYIFRQIEDDAKYRARLEDIHGKQVELNEASERVVRECDGASSVREIADRLAPEFDQTPARTLLARLQLLLATLRDQGVVELLPEPATGRRRCMVPRRPQGRFPLSSLFVEVTDACNLKCRHCYLGEIEQSRRIPLPDLQRVLRQYADVGGQFVTLSGGEPFVRDDFLEVVEFASALPLFVILLSNGMLIDEAAAQRLGRCNIKEVQISLDGARPRTHDEFRGRPGAHAGALRAIEALRREGIRVEVSTVVNRLNCGELPELVDLCQKWDAVPGFSPQQAKGRAIGEGRQYQLSYHEYNRGLIGARAHLAARTGERPFHHRVPPKMNLQAHRCSAGVTSVSVRANGDVYPCLFMNQPEARLGNIFEQDLDEIWNADHAFLNRLRQSTLQDLAFCRECRHFPYCQGGCPVTAFEFWGDYDMPDPKNCSYFTLAGSHLTLETAEDSDDTGPTVIRCDQ